MPLNQFNIGDLVKAKGKRARTFQREMYVTEIHFEANGGFVKYATTSGAWFENKNLELVKAGDKKAIKAMLKLLSDDEEDEE